jgi:hypothetical protein
LSNTISVDELAKVIADDLTQYNDNVIKGVKAEAKKHISKLVKDTKATAPVGHRTKHYRDSIAYKKYSESARAISYVWYVRGSDYRLSHLLEKGHALRNGGRSKAFGFIAKAKAPILESYIKKVEEVLKNG